MIHDFFLVKILHIMYTNIHISSRRKTNSISKYSYVLLLIIILTNYYFIRNFLNQLSSRSHYNFFRFFFPRGKKEKRKEKEKERKKKEKKRGRKRIKINVTPKSVPAIAPPREFLQTRAIKVNKLGHAPIKHNTPSNKPETCLSKTQKRRARAN